MHQHGEGPLDQDLVSFRWRGFEAAETHLPARHLRLKPRPGQYLGCEDWVGQSGDKDRGAEPGAHKVPLAAQQPPT